MRNVIIGLSILACFAIQICNSQVPYPPRVVENINISSLPMQEFNFPTTIVSPSVATANVNISNSANVIYSAGDGIYLKDGFSAGAFTSGEFRAKIESSISVQVLPPAIIQAGVVHINKWEKFEIAFNLPAQYEQAIQSFFNNYYSGTGQTNPATDLNPYADDSITVTINLSSPTNQTKTKWAFFMREGKWEDNNSISGISESKLLEEDFSNSLYNNHWHFRFAPDEENSTVPWTFSITVSSMLPGFPTVVFNGFSFICDSPLPDNSGFLSVNPNNTSNLIFDNGSSFFGISQNLADHRHTYSPFSLSSFRFYKRDYINYSNALQELHANGANMIRVMFTPQDFGMEHSNLGVYDQFVRQVGFCFDPPHYPPYTDNFQWHLWAFDNFMNECRDNNIYTTVVMDPFPVHQAYETFSWGDNALLNSFCNYQHANMNNLPIPPAQGNLYKYFCDPSNLNPQDPNTALYWWKRRYKYFLSRYGYSVNLSGIEMFNEVDLSMQYFGQNFNDPENTTCPNHRKFWAADPNFKLALGKWINYMTEYVKKPVVLGGLEESKLLSISYSYTGMYINDNNLNPLPLNQFYGLYDDNNSSFSDNNFKHLDYLDIHHYVGSSGDPGKNMHKQRYDMKNGDIMGIPNNNIATIFNKPVRFGEIGTDGSIIYKASSTAIQGKVDTQKYYNNLYISLHNDLWGTSFSGNLGTGQSWFYEVIHRWDYAQFTPPLQSPYIGFFNYPTDKGDPFLLYDQNGVLLTSGTISPYYHEYNRLATFEAQIDRTQSFAYKMLYDETQGIEAYYMINGSSESYGWIHNLEHFWYNSYYYTNTTNYTTAPGNDPYRWNTCIVPSISNPILLTGFQPLEAYEISYFYTRLGPVPFFFPQSEIVSADPNGQIEIPPTTLAYLGCDSTTADFAFHITLIPQRRHDVHAKNYDQTSRNNIVFYPNPATDQLNFISDEEVLSIKIVNLQGQQVLNVTNPISAINIKELPAGVYFIHTKSALHFNIDKIIIQ